MSFKIDLNFKIVGVVISAVVGFLLLAALVPTLFEGGRAITENVTTADTGSTIGDTIASTLGPFIPLALVAAVVGLAFVAASLRGSK